MSEHYSILSYFQKSSKNPQQESEQKEEILRKNREEAMRRKQLFKQQSNMSSAPTSIASISPYKEIFSPISEINEVPQLKSSIYPELYSKNEILLKYDYPLSHDSETTIKSFAGRKNPQKSGWIIPISNYSSIKASLLHQSILEFHDIPNFVLRALTETNAQSKLKLMSDPELPRSLASIPSQTLARLYDFQKEGVNFVLERHGRALIGDEMGVGKTIQAIIAASVYMDEWPVLVICPASIKLIWRDEFLRWAPVDRHEIYLLESKKPPKSSARVWIASYSLASSQSSLIASQSFKVIIADECHYLKNFAAQRTKNLVPILQRATRALLLSGTPVISRPSELFTLLQALRPDIFRNFKEFANRYCNPQHIMNRLDYSGNSNIKELHVLLSNTVMIRRLKSDVLTQLPPKLRQKIEIQVSVEHCKKIRKIYAELRENKNNPGGSGLTSAQVNSFISEAYALTAKAKAKGVAEYIAYLMQNECKFLVFGHHLEMLDCIEEQVVKHKVEYIRIDGSVSMEKRNQAVNEFQQNNKCMVAILSILAAGVGLTLTAAFTVVIAEMAWSPGVMIQAEDRVHRIGQKRSVNIHYLFGPATLDEYIWPKIQDKLNVITDALDNSRNTSTASLMHPECRVGIGNFGDLELFNDIDETSRDWVK